MNQLESIASLLALIYVVLAIKELRQCWIAAGVSSLLYIKIFLDAQLYTEAGLQIFFIVLSVKGYLHWRSNNIDRDLLSISRLPIQRQIKGVLMTAFAAMLVGALVKHYTGANYAYFDSAITCFSVYTTWLVTRKILENWIYWIIIDLAAALLYYWKELYLTTGLYLIYSILAYIGFRQWKLVIQTKEFSSRH